LSHAREVAQRLGQEIGEQPRERPDTGLISWLLAAAVLGKPHA